MHHLGSPGSPYTGIQTAPQTPRGAGDITAVADFRDPFIGSLHQSLGVLGCLWHLWASVCRSVNTQAVRWLPHVLRPVPRRGTKIEVRALPQTRLGAPRRGRTGEHLGGGERRGLRDRDGKILRYNGLYNGYMILLILYDHLAESYRIS